MAIWIRNGLYVLALLIATPWLLYRRLATGRYRHGWRHKLLGLPAESSDDSALPVSGAAETIWLHGVSVGEIQLLEPLVNRLQAERPQARLVVSSTTDSGLTLARKIMPPTVRSFYFPLDFSWSVRRTIATLRPTLLILGELELWPNLLAIAARCELPVMVVNGRLSQRSFRGYRRLARWTGPMFRSLRQVCVQTDTYGRRFEDCGVPHDRLTTTGSVKFDNVLFDRQHPQVQELARLVGLDDSARVWVAGSTQIEEEQGALDAFEALRGRWPQLRLIIVPRHPERFDQVARAIEHRQGLRMVRRTDLETPIGAHQWDVLLVDTVGELSRWWGTADLALVGGSFGTRGGQNMIEPAAFGASVVFGPRTSNFRDVVELLLADGAATELQTVEHITPWLDRQLANPAQAAATGQKAAALVRRQQGALESTVREILQVLSQANPSEHPSRAERAPSYVPDAPQPAADAAKARGDNQPAANAAKARSCG